MIDLYALLALPFAHLMQWIVRQSFSIRQFAFRLILFGMMLNVFQTYQYQHAILHWDGMSAKLYKAHFYKIRTSQIYPGLDVPDYERSKRERLP
jgi:hypothetical protein